jgi:hypothetical protein
MTIKEYIEKFYTEDTNGNAITKTKKQKAAQYLCARLDDLEADFPDQSEMINDYVNTELTENSISNLETLCTKYFDTMLSSDVDYIIDNNYSLEELLGIVTTKY